MANPPPRRPPKAIRLLAVPRLANGAHLLTKLADDFVAHGYDLRHTLRRIALSAVYARGVNAMPQNAADDRFYSHALHKPLEPDG